MNEHLFIYLQSSRVIWETMYSRPVLFAKQTPSPHRGPDRPIGVYLVTTAGWFYIVPYIYVRLYTVSVLFVRYFTEKQQYVQFQCLTFDKNESPTILNLNKSNLFILI